MGTVTLPRPQPGDVIGAWTFLRYLSKGQWECRCVCGQLRAMNLCDARARKGCSECARVYRENMTRPIGAIVVLDPNRVKLDDVRDAICERFKIPLRVLVSRKRAWRVSHPRMLGMLLARELTRKSTTKVGGHFGGRDHTTCCHAERKMRERIARSPEWAEHYTALKARLTCPANDHVLEAAE